MKKLFPVLLFLLAIIAFFLQLDIFPVSASNLKFDASVSCPASVQYSFTGDPAFNYRVAALDGQGHEIGESPFYTTNVAAGQFPVVDYVVGHVTVILMESTKDDSPSSTPRTYLILDWACGNKGIVPLICVSGLAITQSQSLTQSLVATTPAPTTPPPTQATQPPGGPTHVPPPNPSHTPSPTSNPTTVVPSTTPVATTPVATTPAPTVKPTYTHTPHPTYQPTPKPSHTPKPPTNTPNPTKKPASTPCPPEPTKKPTQKPTDDDHGKKSNGKGNDGHKKDHH